MEKQGKVYLVGAGPGAWGLMTIRGLALLKCCDAVVYDYLASPEFLSCLKPDCRKIYVGKQAGRHSMKQEEINALLVKLAGEGLAVVRLKGGDPFVFGRGGEEILALEENGISWEIVPGVTSAVAVPELAGIPVTHRGVSRSFHVITGHTMDADGKIPDLGPYAALEGTLVFLMGFGQIEAIAKGLIEGGKSPDTPAAVIERGSLPGQRTVRAPLSALAKEAKMAGLSTPAIIVVGETAALELRAEKPLPLAGKRIGITGTASFSERLKRALEKEGAAVRQVLEMELVSYVSSKEAAEAYRNLKSYTWLAFTSANGVRLFFEGLREYGMDIRAVCHLKFAVIGDGTSKELEKHGIQCDYMPERFCAESLAEGLAAILTPEDKLLLARANQASVKLTEILSDAGISFDDIPFYEVKPSFPEGKEELLKGLDYLTFASASGVRGFFACFGEKPFRDGKRPKLACIGDITAKELLQYGMKADITAASYHIEGLTAAMTGSSHEEERS